MVLDLALAIMVLDLVQATMVLDLVLAITVLDLALTIMVLDLVQAIMVLDLDTVDLGPNEHTTKISVCLVPRLIGNQWLDSLKKQSGNLKPVGSSRRLQREGKSSRT